MSLVPTVQRIEIVRLPPSPDRQCHTDGCTARLIYYGWHKLDEPLEILRCGRCAGVALVATATARPVRRRD